MFDASKVVNTTETSVSVTISRHQTPEERELEAKRAQLTTLEAELAQRELDLATGRAELDAFHARYLSIVGVKFAELDELKAKIAEVEALRNPQSAAAQRQAEQARAQAQESRQDVGETAKHPERANFKPSEDLKKLFREAVKRLHPDLAADEADRERRTRAMADANRAYADGDVARLQAILHDWDASPESVQGEGVAMELIRVIRKLAQVSERLRAIETETKQLHDGELWQLRTKVQDAERARRDLLAEMVRNLEANIAAAREQLTRLNGER